MSGLLRDELIELGVSVPTAYLTEWASGQVEATKGREQRLAARGFDAACLAEIRELICSVERRQGELGTAQGPLPKTTELTEQVRVEALGYWREAKAMARAAFATQPDLLATFRTGVQTGLLLMNLVRELESTIARLREHQARLAPLGVSEDFIARGERLIARLKDVKSGLDAACRDLPATAAAQCHDKGLLYDRTRRLVRIGRLEYRAEPELASSFNFSRVRAARGGRS